MPQTSKKLGHAISDLDLRLLRVFKAVVESGGLSAAQVELGIGLATISKHLADLETRLSMRLCTRGHERFGLTDNGQAVYQAALELFSSIDDFRARLGNARDELVGELTVGVVDGTVTDPGSPLIVGFRRFRERAPRVHLRLAVTSPDDIEMGLIEGRLTLGILPAFQRLPSLDYVALYDEVSQLYCATAHPLFSRPDGEISEEELGRQHYVDRGYTESPSKRQLSRSLAPSATAWHCEAVAMLILTGDFVGFLPTHYAAQWCAARQMRPLCPDSMSYQTTFCLAHRKGMKENRVVKRLIDDIRSVAASEREGCPALPASGGQARELRV